MSFRKLTTNKITINKKSGRIASLLTLTHGAFELENKLKNFSLFAERIKNKMKITSTIKSATSKNLMNGENLTATGASQSDAIKKFTKLDTYEKKDLPFILFDPRMIHKTITSQKIERN